MAADLANPAVNTGDAAGDIYVGIENLEGTAAGDVLSGDNGNNTLIGREGADILDGRGGSDWASYITSIAGLTANLADPGSDTGDAAGDVYINIEGLSGSQFDDTLVGNAANNLLEGRGGADILIGGGGFDYVFHNSSPIGITIDLSNPENNTGKAAGDTFSSIEGIRGSEFDDILIGDDIVNGGTALNILRGGLGADIRRVHQLIDRPHGQSRRRGHEYRGGSGRCLYLDRRHLREQF